MKAFNLAARPDSLGSPWRPLDALAYTLPYPSQVSRPGRAAAWIGQTTWHNRNYLKVIVRGFTPLLYAYATKGISPLTAYPRAA